MSEYSKATMRKYFCRTIYCRPGIPTSQKVLTRSLNVTPQIKDLNNCLYILRKPVSQVITPNKFPFKYKKHSIEAQKAICRTSTDVSILFCLIFCGLLILHFPPVSFPQYRSLQ